MLLPSELALLNLQLDLIQFNFINPVILHGFSPEGFEDELCFIPIDISVNIVLFTIVNIVYMIFFSYSMIVWN